ncbi:hypothetical protein HYX13_00955 [Candidatus Woesearchaeota archaeon]|nr:hypothetical protein [Candidatus Woesearchaeota archaeon]
MVLLFTFADVDGDKVADSCDACSESQAGRVVNSKGCTDGEVPDNETLVDDDEDGLPGYWERLYASSVCPLNEKSPDSDMDGVGDGAEDYDNDGASNYEEYLARSDPCLASDSPDFPKNATERKKDDKKLDPAPPGPSPFPPGMQKSKVMAWSLFFIGVFMVFAGAGYLVYYYRSLPKSRRNAPAAVSTEESVLKKYVSPEEEKQISSQQGRGTRSKVRKRKELFGTFDQASESIPRIAQKYKESKENKEKIVSDSGLRQEKKSTFSQLENLAKKSSGKDLGKAYSPEKSKDLFSELRELSKKKKQK